MGPKFEPWMRYMRRGDVFFTNFTYFERMLCLSLLTTFIIVAVLQFNWSTSSKFARSPQPLIPQFFSELRTLVEQRRKTHAAHGGRFTPQAQTTRAFIEMPLQHPISYYVDPQMSKELFTPALTTSNASTEKRPRDFSSLRTDFQSNTTIMPSITGTLPAQGKLMAMAVPDASRQTAIELDKSDPLRSFRSQFHNPYPVYLCGNSLGLMPIRTSQAIQTHLDKWSSKAVHAHFTQPQPWASIEERAAELSLPIVGARFSHEVSVMNSLTVNIHLFLVSFYQPKGKRSRILIEQHAFPSDEYALQTHIKSRGLDPQSNIIRLSPRPGEILLQEADILATIQDQKDELALVLLPGVQYYTGQVFPMRQITEQAHKHGIPVGFDLAHAVGNIPLSLHEWGVDFAVWCNYKYLNSGPGAVSGVFLHDKHAESELHRHAGWWGHDRETRFEMPQEFVPQKGARGFQLSNPPVLSLVPVTESLGLIAEAGGIQRLRRKSVQLTGFLEQCLERLARSVEIISPKEERQRGCQLSLRLKVGGEVRIRDVNEQLSKAGVVCDVREPDVLRVAPAPLYNSFEDVWRFVQVLEEVLEKRLTESGSL